MTPRERVLTALSRREPDRVPYLELGVDRALAQRLLGWREPSTQRANLESQPYTAAEAKEVARHLGLDNLSFVLRAPVYAEKLAGKEGRLFYGAGRIRSRADLGILALPDPEDDELYREAREFAAQKDEYAACFVTRAGIFPVLLSMGIEAFSTAVYDDRGLVEELLDRYYAWSVAVARRVRDLGFDIYITTDDMAYKTAPYFSPALFRELVLPRYRALAREVTLPWVVHSDGNILPFLDDLVDVGIAGIHPLENGAVDIRAIKRDYGGRLCLLGNVDLNLLGAGPPEAVDAEVRGLIRDLAPGGGYILTSGNSLAGYCLPENVRALAAAARRYGVYGALPTGGMA
jgi:uroporphyrinogen decarboxylase